MNAKCFLVEFYVTTCRDYDSGYLGKFILVSQGCAIDVIILVILQRTPFLVMDFTSRYYFTRTYPYEMVFSPIISF